MNKQTSFFFWKKGGVGGGEAAGGEGRGESADDVNA